MPEKKINGGTAMADKNLVEILRPVQFFSSLSDEEIGELASKLKIKRFLKNDTILYEEDTNKYMYIILEGKVKVMQMSDEGKETILAMHRAGEFFGEMSLIDGKTMPATVVATENTVTAIISREDFYSLIFTQSKLLEGLLKILCTRLRKSWDLIQILNFNNAKQRLKMLFYQLSDEYGVQTPEGITLDMRLTHRDIANMAGITRETATRIIDKWQKEKEIIILENKYICLSPDFLRKGIKEGI